MSTYDEKVKSFLAADRIAVAGVSRKKDGTANIIYRKLKNAGYQMYPVNPNVETFDDDRCYPDLMSIPGSVDGVVIVTQPSQTDEIVKQCAEAGVPRAWMHQSFAKMGSSVSPQAVKYCRDHDITVIAGGCPMMFCEPVDAGHKCIRWILRMTGSLPSKASIQSENG